jgi:hypothetical protein
VRDARGDDDVLREHLRHAEGDFGNGRLHVLPETREAAVALRSGVWMQMRDAGRRPVALDDLRLRSELGMMMRRGLRARNNNESDRGNQPPYQHRRVFCHELRKQTLYERQNIRLFVTAEPAYKAHRFRSFVRIASCGVALRSFLQP